MLERDMWLGLDVWFWLNCGKPGKMCLLLSSLWVVYKTFQSIYTASKGFSEGNLSDQSGKLQLQSMQIWGVVAPLHKILKKKKTKKKLIIILFPTNFP